MKKALKWILIIFLILLVGLIALVACFGGSSTDEETSAANEAIADMTPQQIDLEIYGAVRSAAASYNELNTMMQQLDTGETSLLELYDYCEQVKDWGLDWSDKVDAMTNDDTAEYAEAAGTYVKAVAFGIATPLMEYIDENKMEDLSDANETLGLMPAYFLEVESARSAYLSNSGLSEEEIQQQFDLG